MIFKLYNSDFGIKINDVSYDFTHVDGLTYEDPRYNRIVRGANAGNDEGLVYTEGNKEPFTITVNVLGMPTSLKNVLVKAFKERTRLDSVYCIDRTDGSSKTFRKAIICQEPLQLTIDESQESMNVALTFQSFVCEDVQKSE